MAEEGERWRRLACSSEPLPEFLVDRWNKIMAISDREIASLCAIAKHDNAEDTPERAGVDALIELCALADEASRGLGVTAPINADQLWLHSTDSAEARGTLCRDIDPSLAIVLPKLHTPQVGMTMRSLTHHLALCPSSNVRPSWSCLTTSPAKLQLNLLLFPWPRSVAPTQFRPICGPIENLPSRFGFFTFDPSGVDADLPRIGNIVANARKLVGDIDGVIFPELSLTGEQYERVIRDIGDSTFVVAGVAAPAKSSSSGCARFGRNSYRMNLPQAYKRTLISQAKHHRWRIDRQQVLQYGLGSSLRPDHVWWEYCALEDRHLTFVTLTPWLTLCVLICEDLARQDPVADLVRAVGPNLVVALLMDGPQLRARWPARYATVLADDPGSSVLTLTSVGMATLSRSAGHEDTCRTIALWHDAQTPGPREIELAAGADAIVLSLSIETVEEFTADGRTDHGHSGYPILAGVHYVSGGAEPAAKGEVTGPDPISLRDAHFLAMMATVAGSTRTSRLEVEEFIAARAVDDPEIKNIARLVIDSEGDLAGQPPTIRDAVKRARDWARRNKEAHVLH